MTGWYGRRQPRRASCRAGRRAGGTAPPGRSLCCAPPPAPPRSRPSAARGCPCASSRSGVCPRSRRCPDTSPPRSPGARRVGKRRHVGADLRDQHLRRPSADPGNGRQPLQRVLNRAQPLGDLRTHLRDAGIQEVDVGQLPRQQEALMGANAPRQRPLQRRELVAQPALGQLRHRRRIGLARRPVPPASAGWTVP